MTISTCDVVEAGSIASASVLISISTQLLAEGLGTSIMKLVVSSMLVSGGVADSSASLVGYNVITESMTAHDTWTTQTAANSILVSEGTGSSVLINTPANSVTESGSSSSSVVLSRIASLDSFGIASEVATPSKVTQLTALSSGAGASVLFGYSDKLVIDLGTAHETLCFSVRSNNLLIDHGLAQDSTFFAFAPENLLVSSGTAASSLLTHLVANSIIAENGYAQSSLLFNPTTQAWVMNSENYAMSRYTQLPFTSLAVISGRLFGIGEAGLYEMKGDTDLGVVINASVVTDQLLLGSQSIKKVTDVLIGGTAAGAMALTVETTTGTYSYSVPVRSSASVRARRAILGKGLNSLYWKFTLANEAGADFLVDNISIDVAPSTNRRI